MFGYQCAGQKITDEFHKNDSDQQPEPGGHPGFINLRLFEQTMDIPTKKKTKKSKRGLCNFSMTHQRL